MSKKAVLTTARRKLYEADAVTLAFWRKNPCIAVRDLLGIYLSDAQNWMFASSWNAEKICWSCSRNFGKSFLIAIFAVLKAILYPNQNIYIISSVGNQAKETFTKIEEIALRVGKTADSVPDLKDILAGEIQGNATNPSGFKHDPSGYSVSFYNGSKIFTLNSEPDSNRGKRATLVIYDEAAFVSPALIEATIPFITQNANAQYSEDSHLLSEITPKKCPTQALYASSQDSVDTVFYKRYREYAKYMIAGDKRFFVCDMPCTTAITMFMKGKQVPALLSQSVVDAEMKSNPDKARREYYNKPDLTGGASQIIKWGTMRDNERQIIPYVGCRGNKIVLAFDPARTIDNSIVSTMELVEDPKLGLCGNIVGCTNLVDVASRKKYKLDSNRQIIELRNLICAYNEFNPDYEYIDSVLVDSGSGGGGVSTYSDGLLNDFIGPDGKTHKGLIDAHHEIYSGYRSRYPHAVDKLRLISPRKYRTQMVEEFIELMELGVIRFPYQYGGQEYLKIVNGIDKKTGEENMETYNLSQDEIINLTQIDLMKTEICNIHKSSNAEGTSVSYALAKEKQNIMHKYRCAFAA